MTDGQMDGQTDMFITSPLLKKKKKLGDKNQTLSMQVS